MIDKIVAHSKTVLAIAEEHGWLLGARYTNLRDVSSFSTVHFIDIDWKNYDFKKHLEAVKIHRPKYTVAKDWENPRDLPRVLEHAEILSNYAEHIIVVPKVEKLKHAITGLIPKKYILGYSVPTQYGGTMIEPEFFQKRNVHLLGGRPERQRELAKQLKVVSIDCNRFTLDAQFGDYFNGEKFIPHPKGGYQRCLRDSIKNINEIWKNYECQARISNANVRSNV